jgi:hypothetical protein
MSRSFSILLLPTVSSSKFDDVGVVFQAAIDATIVSKTALGAAVDSPEALYVAIASQVQSPTPEQPFSLKFKRQQSSPKLP